MWERHRQVVAQVLEAAPRVQPNTVVVATGIGRDPDPFGDNMWFDFALRLAYRGVPVAGQYFYADGTRPAGASLALRKRVWRATGQGFPTEIVDVPLSHTVVVQYRSGGHGRLLQKVPAYVLNGSDGSGYAPRVVDGQKPSEWATRRYGG
jgi:hypothetical protein